MTQTELLYLAETVFTLSVNAKRFVKRDLECSFVNQRAKENKYYLHKKTICIMRVNRDSDWYCDKVRTQSQIVIHKHTYEILTFTQHESLG